MTLYAALQWKGSSSSCSVVCVVQHAHECSQAERMHENNVAHIHDWKPVFSITGTTSISSGTGCLSVHSHLDGVCPQPPWWRLSFHLCLDTIFAGSPMILIFMFVVWLFLSPNYNTTKMNSRIIQSQIKWKKKTRRDWSCQGVFNKITLKLFILCLYSLRRNLAM